jgi:hypothetical protein
LGSVFTVRLGRNVVSSGPSALGQA